MADISKHKGAHTLPVLLASVRRSDTIWGNVTAMRAEEQAGQKYTIGEHDFAADPLGKLTLIVLDDNGDGAAPDGTKIVVKGTAWIENQKKKIGVCR